MLPLKQLQLRTPSTAWNPTCPLSRIRRLAMRTSTGTPRCASDTNTAPSGACGFNTRRFRMAPRCRSRHTSVGELICQIGNWFVFVILIFLGDAIRGEVVRECRGRRYGGSRSERPGARGRYGFDFSSTGSRLVRSGLTGRRGGE